MAVVKFIPRTAGHPPANPTASPKGYQLSALFYSLLLYFRTIFEPWMYTTILKPCPFSPVL